MLGCAGLCIGSHHPPGTFYTLFHLSSAKTPFRNEEHTEVLYTGNSKQELKAMTDINLETSQFNTATKP